GHLPRNQVHCPCSTLMAPSLTWTMTGTWPARSTYNPVASATEPTFGELGEAALIEACLEGRSGAFDVIVERHRRTVYQLCWRFVGNHEDASDLSQDIFLRAYKGLRSFRGQSSLATWLYRIGVNVCLNRMSAKGDKITEAIDDRQFVDTRGESPSERLLKEERGARVRAAIAE